MQSKWNLKTKNIILAVIIIFLIPLTILFGVYFLNDRKYYFISLLIVIYTMMPFFMAFEKRKPQARELILIAVLSAIAIASRAAFFMLPQFKPVIAIVIIAGVCFGEETGFLTGAITAFVSNFFFGQGPWTPWQMFCFGIIGFLAGVLARKGILRKTRLQLCIFGGFATLFIYGGIINLSTLMISTPKFTLGALLSVYIAGFWFDIIHAVATIVFMFFISEPMIEKLDRIKIKYGFINLS
jgi:energy-coupling factor transport system substrate-specific component